MKIKRKDSTIILNSLLGGVVPHRGIEHIVVGRTAEATQILHDLEDVKAGSSMMKFFIGPFGSGKSFLQALTQQLAFQEKFVVAHADFTPERRLYGNDRKAVAIYTALMKSLSIPTVPEGNALPHILEQWIGDVQLRIAAQRGETLPDLANPSFVQAVEEAIVTITAKMDVLTGGFDFARVLTRYYQGFVTDNSLLQRNALRWLCGEYATKTEAKEDLGVRVIIDDQNYYDFLKVMALFMREIGYAGLVLNFDEAINLYKITHAMTREKNYETILKMYNDTLQGTSTGLYITFGGTLEFLENERRGLFSYDALKTRLQSNRYESTTFRDLSQPVIKLTPLQVEETFVLLQKISTIHALHYGYVEHVTSDELTSFLKEAYSRPGATEHVTTRDMVRHFIGALNVLQQNPTFDRTTIFKQPSTLSQDTPSETPHARFTRFSE